MATDAFDYTAAGELLVSHQDTVTIEEVAGRKIARFSQYLRQNGGEAGRLNTV